jgi:hypothetical protein
MQSYSPTPSPCLSKGFSTPILPSLPTILAISNAPRVMSVSISPGQIALTRILLPASSYAAVWAREMTAAFEAE